MKLPSCLCILIILQALCIFPFLTQVVVVVAQNSNLFRDYIGALSRNVTFDDVPINRKVQFHFILSFAIDYTNENTPKPTNGQFNIFWDADILGPSQVLSIKQRHPNVRVALSVGSSSVDENLIYFSPESVDSWVSNAVTSLTEIIKQYHLDGIDIDYEHFKANASIFTECIGRLLQTLKNKEVISFASIAPYADEQVQEHYLALWKGYGSIIDYVIFQFYSYANTTTVTQFLHYFGEQTSNYAGGKVLASFLTQGSGGLSPRRGFFKACKKLKKMNELFGIFNWCADSSKAKGFVYEKKSQKFLAKPL